MVAAERVTTRQRQRHELTAALSGAGTVTEAAEALTTGLCTALGASVVARKATVAVELAVLVAAHRMLDRGQPFPGAGRRLPPAPTIT